MTGIETLLALESGFWTEGAEFYGAHADAQCLVAFGDMAGVLAREELVGTVGAGPRWQKPDLKIKGFLEPTPGFALLTYEAHAEKVDGSRSYDALVTSGYVRRDGAWKLAFHQQSPLKR
jgi:hypothetical protein